MATQRLAITSPEADVLHVLIELGSPASVKQIQERLPERLDNQIYHQLIRLRDRYGLVTRQKTLEKKDVWRRVFLYQPTDEAKKKYLQALLRSISRRKTKV